MIITHTHTCDEEYLTLHDAFTSEPRVIYEAKLDPVMKLLINSIGRRANSALFTDQS